METVPTHPPSQSSSDAASPLLRRRRRRVIGRGGPLPPLRNAAARFLRRPLARRMMLTSPSFLVRENAAEHLEHHRNDWSYSAPAVALDVVLNLVLVGVALFAVVLGGVGDEDNDDDDDVELIRVWVIGYGVGCVVHLACVVVECRERLRGRGRERSEEAERDDSDEEDGGIQTSILKHVESANTMFSCVWWVIGAYWVTSANPSLMQNSPELYWVCISFLAFDIIFVVLCVAITCLIGIAVCCFLPCIIAILYAMADQFHGQAFLPEIWRVSKLKQKLYIREGATQEEIEQLRKFKFRRIMIECEGVDGQIQSSSGGIMMECDSSTPMEQTLSEEDTECCICLCAYEDGAELRQLPCGHYFHSSCIDKWLFINAICPLCKFNILKPGDREEV